MQISLKNVYPVLLALLIAFTYQPVFDAGFVYDDEPYIVQNPAVNNPTLKNVFADNFPAGRKDTALYRPLVTCAYLLDRKLAGGMETVPVIGHIQNLVWHYGVCLILFLLISRHFNPLAASVAVSIYAVHPVLTESVAWITARSELMSVFWGILGVFVITHSGHRWLVKSLLLAVCFLMAVLTKESSVFYPVLWLFTSLVLQKDTGLKRTAVILIPSLVLLIVYIGLRYHFTGGLTAELTAYAGQTAETKYKIIFMAFFRYVMLLIYPADLTVHWPPYPMMIDKMQFKAGAVELLVILGLIVYGFMRDRKWVIIPLWFMIGILPYSNMIFPIGAIMAERFLYLPAMAIAFLAAWLFWLTNKNRNNVMPAVVIAVALILVVAGIRKTYFRAIDWHDDITLWGSAAKVYPDNLNAQAATIYYLVLKNERQCIEEAAVRLTIYKERLKRFGLKSVDPLVQLRIRWSEYELQRYYAPKDRD